MAAVSDPAQGGFASSRLHLPVPQPLTELRATFRQLGRHRPGPPLQAHQCPPAVRGNTFPTGRSGWLAGLAVGTMPPAAPRLLDVASHPWAPGGRKLGVGPRVCTVPRCDLVNNA